MEIFQPGTEITFKNSHIHGFIRTVTMSSNNTVVYNIGWWAGDNYNTSVFMPEEFDVKNAEDKKTIGFGKLEKTNAKVD
mgnify:FL=1